MLPVRHAMRRVFKRGAAMAKKLARLDQVRELVPYSRSEIYRLMALGQFPKNIRIGARAVAWDLDEVQAWIAARIASRDQVTL